MDSDTTKKSNQSTKVSTQDSSAKEDELRKKEQELKQREDELKKKEQKQKTSERKIEEQTSEAPTTEQVKTEAQTSEAPTTEQTKTKAVYSENPTAENQYKVNNFSSSNGERNYDDDSNKGTGTPSATYYPNCTAAKAAGAAPVSMGQPGYGKHLDRDGDGIGCDK